MRPASFSFRASPAHPFHGSARRDPVTTAVRWHVVLPLKPPYPLTFAFAERADAERALAQIRHRYADATVRAVMEGTP